MTIKTFKKGIKYLLYAVLTPAGLIFIYLLAAVVLTVIPANHTFEPPDEGIEVFVRSNGVHADITVPVTSEIANWHQFIPMGDFDRVHSSSTYVSFGWGDKGFYLNTPTWDDLTFSTAVSAVFLPSPTAMHVEFIRNKPVVGKFCKKTTISFDQYQQLVEYIRDSFHTDADGQIRLISHSGYGFYDRFYDARGSYSLFKTCNNWTNTGLKRAGVKTALWAPFDKCIFYHLKE